MPETSNVIKLDIFWFGLVYLNFVVNNVLAYFSHAGIILEYELRDKTRELKEIDLLHLSPE